MNDDADFSNVISSTYYLIAAVLIVFAHLSWSFFSLQPFSPLHSQFTWKYGGQ
jgi:hypothetical protein